MTENVRRREFERIEGEEQAKRDLEQHARKLALEVQHAWGRSRPNPWLNPWDVSPAATAESKV